jgi:uncharacterized OB-fold protein
MTKRQTTKGSKMGWICPVCGRGNAPMALGCYHCSHPQYYGDWQTSSPQPVNPKDTRSSGTKRP